MVFSQHVGILLVVCAAFVGIVFSACIRSFRFHASFRRDIGRLLDDIREAPGKVLPNWVGLPQWLSPFVSSIKNSFHLTQARDAASKQLEEMLAADREYLKLQKLQTAAPLVGVLLTAIGFITAESDMNDVRSLAVPLVGGVAMGATIALLSQLLIYFVELDIDKSRRNGQLVLDEIWVKATRELEDPHHSVLLAVGKLEESTSLLTLAIGSFPTHVPALTQKFNEIHEVAKETFSTLAGIIPQLKSTSSEWRTAASILKESTEKDLIPSHKNLSDGLNLLHMTSHEFSAIVGQLQEACENLKAANFEQKSLHTALLFATKEQAEVHASTMLNQAISFEDTQKRMVGQSIDNLKSLMGQLSETVSTHLNAIRVGTDEIKGPLQETAAYLSAAAPSLQGSADILSSIEKASKDFSETISKTIIPSYQNLKLFEALAQEMQVSVQRLADSLDGIAIASQAGQQFSDLIRRRALPTVEVLQRATGSFEDSVTLLSECTMELSNVLDGLTRFNSLERSDRASRQDE